MKAWMRWLGIAALVLAVAGCGGSRSSSGGSSSPEWETLSRNQVAKFLDGFANKDVDQMAEAMASQVTLVTDTETLTESKFLILAVFEAAFEHSDISNFNNGPIQVSRSGALVNATVNVSYNANGPVSGTWMFVLEQIGGIWLIRQWEIDMDSVSSLNLSL